MLFIFYLYELLLLKKLLLTDHQAPGQISPVIIPELYCIVGEAKQGGAGRENKSAKNEERLLLVRRTIISFVICQKSLANKSSQPSWKEQPLR